MERDDKNDGCRGSSGDRNINIEKKSFDFKISVLESNINLYIPYYTSKYIVPLMAQGFSLHYIVSST